MDIKAILKIHGLYKLEKLDLSCNYINCIDSLDPLINLTDLNLSNNRIDGIPSILPSLKKLDLSHNQIQHIPLLCALELEELYLNNNEIYKIHPLYESRNIKVLRLSDNKITKIQNLPNGLTTLRLDGNQIEKIEGIPITVNNLDLSNNKITEIEGLHEGIIELDLSCNKITRIEGLPSTLKELYIYNNYTALFTISILKCKSLIGLYTNSSISAIIRRFIKRNRVRDVDKKMSLHDIMETKIDTDRKIISEVMDDPILSDQTKQIIVERSKDTRIKLGSTFAEVFAALWTIITAHSDCKYIKIFLDHEMKDNICTTSCTTILSVLVGVINGYTIPYEDYSCIVDTIINIKSKNMSKKAETEEIRNMLNGKMCPKHIIDEWISYLKYYFRGF
jgi:hypothetical protein